MATIRDSGHTLRASGGDYTTISGWLSTESGIDSDLVTGDEILQLTCYDDWPSGLSDQFDVTGFTTSATNYVKITVASGERYTGTSGSGFYLSKFQNFGYIGTLTDDYCEIEYVEIINTGTSGAHCLNVQNNSTVTSCVAKASTAGYGFGSIGSGSVLANCLAYDCGYDGFNISGFSTAEMYNCTAVDNGRYGFYMVSGSTGTIKNCVAYNSTTADFSGSWGTRDYNASGDATATGTNSVTGIGSTDFVAYASNDFTPANGGSLEDAGTDVSADSGVSVDLIGNSRGATWDIGALEYVSSGTEIVGTVGALVIAGVNASLDASTNIIGTVGAVSIAGVNAQIEAATNIVGTVGAATINGVNATIVISTDGVLTTNPLKNNTGTVIASDTGITVDVYSVSTGALVERFTGETTDASGILVVSSANITASTAYTVVIRRSTNALGLDEITAT